jgi:hypothetical protein
LAERHRDLRPAIAEAFPELKINSLERARSQNS